MVGVRRPLRQVMAAPSAPAAAAPPEISYYRLPSLRVPAGVVKNSQQEREIDHVRGPNRAANDRLNLDRTKGYIFALKMPSASSMDRLSTLGVYRRYSRQGQAALQTTKLTDIVGASGSGDDKYWLWGLGPADFADTVVGGTNQLIFNVVTGFAAKAGNDARYTLSAVEILAAAWG